MLRTRATTEFGLESRGNHKVRIGKPGDVNDDGMVSVADIFYLINHLFAGGPPPVVSGDVNGDGAVTVADVIYMINLLFAGFA